MTRTRSSTRWSPSPTARRNAGRGADALTHTAADTPGRRSLPSSHRSTRNWWPPRPSSRSSGLSSLDQRCCDIETCGIRLEYQLAECSQEGFRSRAARLRSVAENAIGRGFARMTSSGEVGCPPGAAEKNTHQIPGPPPPFSDRSSRGLPESRSSRLSRERRPPRPAAWHRTIFSA